MNMKKFNGYKIGQWIFLISLVLWVPVIILGWIGVIPYFIVWICIVGEFTGIGIKMKFQKQETERRMKELKRKLTFQMNSIIC